MENQNSGNKKKKSINLMTVIFTPNFYTSTELKSENI